MTGVLQSILSAIELGRLVSPGSTTACTLLFMKVCNMEQSSYWARTFEANINDSRRSRANALAHYAEFGGGAASAVR
jgi:hypothetical protein